MEIGILSARTPKFKDNVRIASEIRERGHVPVFIDYTNTVITITEAGRQLMLPERNGKFKPVRVDSIIARVGSFTSAAANAMAILDTDLVPTTASAASILLARNKLLSQIAFDKAGIPTPYTIAPTQKTPKKPDEVLSMIEPDKKRKIIIKTTTGSLGMGVVKSDSRSSAISSMQGFGAKKIPYIVQEFIDAPDTKNMHSDIRLFVVDGLIVAAMKRQSKNPEEFRANLALGASGTNYEPTPREAELALRAYDVIGAKVAGVDIMGSHRGPLVTEVNGNPGLGIETITGVNIAGAIVNFAIENAE